MTRPSPSQGASAPDVASTRRLRRLGHLAAGVGPALAGARSMPHAPFVIAPLAIDVPALLACPGRPTDRGCCRDVRSPSTPSPTASPARSRCTRSAALTHPAVLASALGWTAQITLDRATGHTLRNPDGSRR